MAGRRASRQLRTVSDLEQAVLRWLDTHPQRGFKLKEIQRELGVAHSRYRLLRDVVRNLAGAGRIAALPRRRFSSLKAATRLEGIVEGLGQAATHVRLESGTRLALSDFAREQVVPGDEVRVRKTRDGADFLAEIERVMRAAPRLILGELSRVGSRWVLEPESPVPGFRGGAFVSASCEIQDEAEGAFGRGWLPAFDPATERPQLEEVEVLGSSDHVQVAMLVRIARDGWPGEFGPRAQEIAAAERDADLPRRDLTEEFVFTIDPAEAKDHDDAISIEEHEDGSFTLGVHIADVACRVPEDSALDDEAFGRATSVYPPGRVLPMLPERLSAGACSLHHGGSRDTITARMHYDASGRRRRIDLGLSRIRSRASLSYEDAEAMLLPVPVRVAAERMADGTDPQELARSVGSMYRLAGKLREHRRELGSLFVQRPEREFHFDAQGDVDEVRFRDQLRAHWIIEEFMLEANRAVAEILQSANLPLLWRVHESPDELKVEQLRELLEQFGVKWVPGEPVTGHDYASLFAQIDGRPERGLLHLLALRSLMKACYRAGWDRHFGLAFQQYTHFTSPIRRYPDLHNQRWIHRLVLAGSSDGWLDNAPSIARALSPARLARPADFEDAHRLADHCSERERTAQRIERDCADICAAAAIKSQEGESIQGMIVSVLRSGLFVELGETGLNGFVGVEQLRRDWYELDTVRHALVGERTGRRFRLGQTVSVLLEYVDVAQGRVWLGELKVLAEPGGSQSQPGDTTSGKKERAEDEE